jgi:hypothetical protein
VNISQGKRKIVAIRKPAKKDAVRDEDYEAVAEAQAFAGLAGQRARRLACELNERLFAGAVDESDRYYLDGDLRVVDRTREIPVPASPAITVEPSKSLRLAERALASADIEFLRRRGFTPSQILRFRRTRCQVHRQLMLEVHERFVECIALALKIRRLDTTTAWRSRASTWLCVHALMVIGLVYVLYPEFAHRAAVILIRRLESIAADLIASMPEVEMGDAPSA